jgi:uncharacterized membrane protein YqjE
VSTGDGHPGPFQRLLDSLGSLLATAIGIGRTRLELLSVELQEELHRVTGLLAWALIGLLAAGWALLFAGLAIVLAFWDTHRVLAAAAVMAAYAALAAVAGLVIRARVRSRPRFLAATLGELARDEAALRERLP